MTTIVAPMASVRRGRTRITSKALSRVVSAVTADALDVSAARVGVELTDERGDLALVVSTPIRLVSLNRVAADGSIVQRTGGSVLERSAAAQREIRERVEALTGSRIARVIVRLTGAHITREERVR